jgi:hypothetical protein
MGENIMTKRLNDFVNVTQALENSAWAAGTPVGTLINATGYGRARFVFSFGANSGTTAGLSSGLGVWGASTSGATFSNITSMAAVTSGVLSNNVMVIDVPVTPATPWLKVSGGSVLSTAINASAIVELYASVSRPKTSLAQQVVVA